VVAGVGLLGLFGWLVIPAAVDQTQQLAAHAPHDLDRLEHASGVLGTLEQRYDLAQRLRETTTQLPAVALRRIPGLTASAGGILVSVLTVAVLSLYFLVGLPAARPRPPRRWPARANTATATSGSWRSR
jgi:predicted PurR-regulated permease PerM